MTPGIQDPITVPRKNRSFTDTLEDEIMLPSDIRNGVTVYGCYTPYLYGYTDLRYVGNDKGDYIKTPSGVGGIEYSTSDFDSIPCLNVGGNVVFYRRATIDRRSLYAVTSPAIAAETVPADKGDALGRTFLDLGIFMGIDSRWWGSDLGLVLRMDAYDEKERQKYDPDGNVIDVKGRGWVWDDMRVRMSFFMRLGQEKSPHFTFSVFRENYDPVYGIVQSRIIIPFHDYFSMGVGAYLWKTNAVFLEPSVHFAGVTLTFKAGTIINYRDKQMERVGITDSFIYGGSVSYEW